MGGDATITPTSSFPSVSSLLYGLRLHIQLRYFPFQHTKEHIGHEEAPSTALVSFENGKENAPKTGGSNSSRSSARRTISSQNKQNPLLETVLQPKGK